MKTALNNSYAKFFFFLVFFSCIGFVSAIGTAPPLDPNMVLYYHINNNSTIGENSTFIVDSSTRSINASLQGNATINITNGITVNTSVSFDGLNSFLTIPIASRNLTTTSFSFWAYPIQNARQQIILFDNNTNWIGIRSNDNWNYNNGASNNIDTIDYNQWNFIAGTYNGSTWDFYKNGFKSASIVGSLLNITQIVLQGANNYNGSLDEIILYNRTLSNTEIWDNYHNYVECITPKNGTRLGGNTTFCQGTYFLDAVGSNGEGVIRIYANNSIIKGNNTLIVGSQSNTGLLGTRVYNITVRDFMTSGYSFGIKFTSSTSISIINNNYSLGRGIRLDQVNNTIISNETINGLIYEAYQDNTNYTYHITNSSNISIINVNMLNGLNKIGIFDSVTLNLKNNYFYNTSYYGHFIVRSNNISIINNTFDYNSFGVGLYHDYNLYVLNNTFNNSRTNRDNWNINLHLQTVNNTLIDNNLFLNYGVGGIFAGRINNLTIKNNYFNGYSIQDMLSNNIQNTARDPVYAIGLLEIQQTFVDDSFSPDGYNPDSENFVNSGLNISNFTLYKSQNVNLTNNTYGSNVQAYLYSHGAVNLSLNDFPSDTWYRKFQLPTYLVDYSELWINNNFNNLTYVNKSSTYRGDLYQGWHVHSTDFLDQYFISNYIVDKNYLYFKNTNWSLGHTNTSKYPSIYQINIYNQTRSLVYNTNGSVYCNDINNCNNTITITLGSFNSSYVLDNFNLTEGVTRQFSPLSISGTSTSKTITSTLSQGVNATVIVNVAQCSFSATYQGNKINEDSCNDNIATFTLNEIQGGNSILGFTYLDLACSSNTNASVVIILVFSALAIVALTFILVMKFKAGELDTNILIIVFIAIIVGLVLFTQIAQITGGVCS